METVMVAGKALELYDAPDGFTGLCASLANLFDILNIPADMSVDLMADPNVNAQGISTMLHLVTGPVRLISTHGALYVAHLALTLGATTSVVADAIADALGVPAASDDLAVAQ